MFPSEGLAILAGATALAAAVAVVRARQLVYATLGLGVIGIANSALFMLLGYQFLALFNIAVYVGAVVTFLLFTVILFPKVPAPRPEVTMLSAGAAAAVFTLIFATLYAIYGSAEVTPSPVFEKYASMIASDYWVPFIIVTVALVATIIEAFALIVKYEEV